MGWINPSRALRLKVLNGQHEWAINLIFSVVQD